jgi:hypothetical protein
MSTAPYILPKAPGYRMDLPRGEMPILWCMTGSEIFYGYHAGYRREYCHSMASR